MNYNIRFCALAVLAMLSISLTVSADEEAEEVVKMEEVVVTARKREKRSVEVPLSVSSIQGEKFDALRSSGMDVRFLSNRTPSLQMESSFGRIFPRFYIRGLGNTDFDLNASQPVSVLIWRYRGAVLPVQFWIRALLLKAPFPLMATVCRRLRVGLQMYPCAICFHFREVPG